MELIVKTFYEYFVLRNTKHYDMLPFMKTFGETIRELRLAQDFGLREAAVTIGISPAYLSRIERGKERPPRPEVIKALAKLLAADPDVLFRLSSSTDPDVAAYLHEQPLILHLVRFIMDSGFSSEEIDQLLHAAEGIKSSGSQSLSHIPSLRRDKVE
jgi:transcriptional regulator with XRE-family HTH domain